MGTIGFAGGYEKRNFWQTGVFIRTIGHEHRAADPSKFSSPI